MEFLGPMRPKFLKVLQHRAQALAADQPVELLPQTGAAVPNPPCHKSVGVATVKWLQTLLNDLKCPYHVSQFIALHS